MAELLKGKPVTDSINERSFQKVNELKAQGITPCVALVRVGENSSDISYEKGIIKRCSEMGIEVHHLLFPDTVTVEEFYKGLDELNNDNNIHAILLFRPIPEHLDNEKARNYIAFNKDVDGCCDKSLTSVFTNSKEGFIPCTAQAVMEILDYYNIPVSGKKVTVLGRSLVVGKPVSMLLLNRNATVTICHSKTDNIEKAASEADILICATGKLEQVNKDYVNPQQTVIDVGINWSEEKKKICGDCLFEEVEPSVHYITPVPGGVGTVTNAVLINHIVEAAASTTTHN